MQSWKLTSEEWNTTDQPDVLIRHLCSRKVNYDQLIELACVCAREALPVATAAIESVERWQIDKNYDPVLDAHAAVVATQSPQPSTPEEWAVESARACAEAVYWESANAKFEVGGATIRAVTCAAASVAGAASQGSVAYQAAFTRMCDVIRNVTSYS